MFNSATGASRQTDIVLHQEDQRVSVNREMAQAKAALDHRSDEKYRAFYDELSTVWEKQGVSAPEELFAAKGEEFPAKPVKGVRAKRGRSCK